MTTATAPALPQTNPSHPQESLFAWLKPEVMPAPAKAPRRAPAKPAGAQILPLWEPAPKPAPAPKGAAAPAVKAAPVPPAPPAAKPRKKARNVAHVWVVAAEIVVTPKVASIADFRGSFKTEADQRVDALDVYCRGCRRPYDEVKGDPCAAKIDVAPV